MPASKMLNKLAIAAVAFSGIPDGVASHTASAYTATIAVQEEQQSGDEPCGWMGIQVFPMTAETAGSLGMSGPYGAIFGKPESGSPRGRRRY